MKLELWGMPEICPAPSRSDSLGSGDFANQIGNVFDWARVDYRNDYNVIVLEMKYITQNKYNSVIPFMLQPQPAWSRVSASQIIAIEASSGKIRDKVNAYYPKGLWSKHRSIRDKGSVLVPRGGGR